MLEKHIYIILPNDLTFLRLGKFWSNSFGVVGLLAFKFIRECFRYLWKNEYKIHIFTKTINVL